MRSRSLVSLKTSSTWYRGHTYRIGSGGGWQGGRGLVHGPPPVPPTLAQPQSNKREGQVQCRPKASRVVGHQALGCACW